MSSDDPSFRHIPLFNANGEEDGQRLASATTSDSNQIHYSNFRPTPSLSIDEYVDEGILPSMDEMEEQVSLVEAMLIDEYVNEGVSDDMSETEELLPPGWDTLTIGEYEILQRINDINEQLSLYEAFISHSNQTQIREENRLSEDTIISHLKRRIHISSANQELEICVICQAEYEEGDDIGAPHCGHSYHVDCIKRWLLKKDSCPLCKAAVLNV